LLVLFSVVLNSETGNKSWGRITPRQIPQRLKPHLSSFGRRHKCLLHPLGLGILRLALASLGLAQDCAGLEDGSSIEVLSGGGPPTHNLCNACENLVYNLRSHRQNCSAWHWINAIFISRDRWLRLRHNPRLNVLSAPAAAGRPWRFRARPGA